MEEYMNERDIQKTEEIDLGRLFRAVMSRAWLVAIVAILCAVLAFVGTFFLVTPQYQSAAMFYVNNNNVSIGDASLSISSGDLSTSRNLVDSYIVILNTRETLVDVVDYAGVARSYGEVRGMLSAAAVNETEIFRVTVTSPDPQEAEQIANAIAYILPKRIGTIIDGTSAKVVDAAIVPSSPSSPSYPKNTVLGFLLGFVLMVGMIVLREIFDTSIRVEEDITQCCQHPILAAVPNMLASGKGGTYYGASRKKKGKYTTETLQAKRGLLGPNISFAASEAYKLLRTKLQFSFADENDCHIIGVSSALSGEGKSLTAINLAYALSQLDKRVLLVDCDMRRPTLAEKLGILKTPGLSNYLTRQSQLHELTQVCQLKTGENPFRIITAGQNPPNPMELLSSTRMHKALESFRKTYDFVILDLPPVGEVGDALAIANETDGMLLIVRQNHCDRIVLTDAVRQFEFIHAKILGVVFNAASDNGGNGYYRHYYKRYYKRYYHRYGKRYSGYGYGKYYGSDRKESAPANNEKQ